MPGVILHRAIHSELLDAIATKERSEVSAIFKTLLKTLPILTSLNMIGKFLFSFESKARGARGWPATYTTGKTDTLTTLSLTQLYPQLGCSLYTEGSVH